MGVTINFTFGNLGSLDERSYARVALLYARPASEQLRGISLVTR